MFVVLNLFYFVIISFGSALYQMQQYIYFGLLQHVNVMVTARVLMGQFVSTALATRKVLV